MTSFLQTNKTFLRGLWLNTGSVTAAEIAAAAGFDWLLVDGEHGLNDEKDVLNILRATERWQVPVIVRIPEKNSPLLERVLDFGAAGIMVPDVETAEEATVLARRMQFAPQGCRGLASSCRAAMYGTEFKSYYAEANQRLALICQIETGNAVKQSDAIAAVPGVTGLFIGHSDLTANLGIFGQWDNPIIKDAEKTVLDACRKYGKVPGMLMKSGREVKPYLADGFRMVALGSDGGLLKGACAKLLANL